MTNLQKQLIRARGIAWEQYSREFSDDGELVEFLLARLDKLDTALTETVRKVDDIRSILAKVT